MPQHQTLADFIYMQLKKACFHCDKSEVGMLQLNTCNLFGNFTKLAQ